MDYQEQAKWPNYARRFYRFFFFPHLEKEKKKLLLITEKQLFT